MNNHDFPAVEVRNLSIGYGKRTVLRDLNFSVPCGQIVTLLGGSGCGKSTLLKHIIGLYTPQSGDILLHGKSIVRANPEEKRRIMAGFGVAYQGGALFRSLSVFENVALPLEEYSALSSKEIAARVREKLALVKLEKFESFMPADLSGGMIKRAAFARAMALDPDILFFDEPSAGLDPISSAQLDELILSIRERTGATIMMVTHELPSIYRVSDRVIMLDREACGMIADGPPAELRDRSPIEYVRKFMGRQV